MKKLILTIVLAFANSASANTYIIKLKDHSLNTFSNLSERLNVADKPNI